MRDTVGQGLDEDGLAAVLEGELAGFLDGLADGPDVVAVDADGVDAIANAAAGDAVTAVLLKRGRGNGVAVVAADEDDGAGPRGGDVEGGVEVARAGGSLAEEGDGDEGLVLGLL